MNEEYEKALLELFSIANKFNIPAEQLDELESVFERLWLNRYGCTEEISSTSPLYLQVSKCNINAEANMK